MPLPIEKQLFEAIQKNDEILVRTLLVDFRKHDNELASIEAKDKNGFTSLILAAKKEHLGIIQILIENGADVNAKDNTGNTALMCAAMYGFEAGIRVLLEQKGIDINAKDTNENTALMLAVSNGHTSCTKLLSESDEVNLNAKNKRGRTALMWAAATGFESGLRILLEKKEIDVNAKDHEANTALILAVKKNYKSCTKLLLEQSKEIDINFQQITTLNPLDVNSKWRTLRSKLYGLFHKNHGYNQLGEELSTTPLLQKQGSRN